MWKTAGDDALCADSERRYNRKTPLQRMRGKASGIEQFEFLFRGGLFQELLRFWRTDARGDGRPACKTCGLTLGDFRETGLLGCPDCYSSFRDAIIPVLRSTHGNVQHVGDTPENGSEGEQTPQGNRGIEGKMQKAIQEENFEEAAKLRDELNAKKGEEKE